MPEELKILNDAQKRPEANPHALRIWMAACVVLFFGLAGYFFFNSERWSDRGNELPASFQFDLEEQLTIAPDLIRFREANKITLSLTSARAIASGPEDRIYVAGDQAVHILNGQQGTERVIAVSSAPTCLAVGGADHTEPGRVYVGTQRAVEVFSASGKRVATWPLPHEQSVLTAIAVAERDIFLADAGNRVVWRFDFEGKQLGQIGQPDAARGVPEFVISGSQFDIVVAAEDLLYAVNPGKLQVLAFSFAGDLGATWGQADSTISGFFGCCNPTHLAILPDGRFVTSEKGIPRVKVYSSGGDLEAVVASPKQLGINEQSVGDPRFSQEHSGFDIATDSRGRVLVLDPHSRSIRVFVSTDDPSDSGDRQ